MCLGRQMNAIGGVRLDQSCSVKEFGPHGLRYGEFSQQLMDGFIRRDEGESISQLKSSSLMQRSLRPNATRADCSFMDQLHRQS